MQSFYINKELSTARRKFGLIDSKSETVLLMMNIVENKERIFLEMVLIRTANASRTSYQPPFLSSPPRSDEQVGAAEWDPFSSNLAVDICAEISLKSSTFVRSACKAIVNTDVCAYAKIVSRSRLNSARITFLTLIVYRLFFKYREYVIGGYCCCFLFFTIVDWMFWGMFSTRIKKIFVFYIGT